MARWAKQLSRLPKVRKNSKYSSKWLLVSGLTFVFAIVFGPGLYRYSGLAYNKATQIFPFLPGAVIQAFGVPIPRVYTIYGIDVSHHQGKINWTEVAEKDISGKHISFVFIKATEGVTRQDRHFMHNWKKAGEAGLIRGAYHFFHPSRDAAAQAENFIKNVQLQPGDLPPVLDIEVTNRKTKTQIVEGARKWCKLIEEHYGVKPILYTNPSYFSINLAGEFNDHILWIAHYHPEKPHTGELQWHFWQQTDKASVKGIKGYVDLNVYTGSSSSLQQICIEKPCIQPD